MTLIRKTLAEKGEGLEFVLSDATVDRYGDVVEPTGWDLRNFKKNPIALFGHASGFPIGRWANIRVEGGRLLARLDLAAKGTSARIDELISLVEQGILRAVSVGFRPLEQEPIDKNQPYGAQRYTRQELLETSLVSVPANPAALAVAKSLNLSSETLSLAFGEQADTRRRDLSVTGEHAAFPSSQRTLPKMQTLSMRIEHAQNDLVTKRDQLVELNAADELDLDAIEGLTGQIEIAERTVAALKASEAKIGLSAAPAGARVEPQARRPLGYGQKEVNGFDLMVRAIVVHGLAHHNNKSVEDVLQERYPGHDATAVITKADQTIGTTTVSGWAAELVQTVNQGFVDALTGFSIYPELRRRGIGLNFDGIGTIALPGRTAGTAGGGFFAEGAPIRVGKLTTTSVSLSPFQWGVIVPFSRKLMRHSTPAIEALVRQAILEDAALALDPLLLDATAASTARPAGLLNGVSAVATGFGGGDHEAVKEDFKALLAPFYAANAADGITVVMNPAQGLNLSLMAGPEGDPNWFERIGKRVTLLESTHATAGRLVALRNSDFATAMGDTPSFDVSEEATIHMEDTTPLEIVSGTGPTTADPVRSLWQTASVGVRMINELTWKMRRTGMVQWIDGTSW
jgi:HK97 family phage prohead protease/HK97 family phage major capsid protein